MGRPETVKRLDSGSSGKAEGGHHPALPPGPLHQQHQPSPLLPLQQQPQPSNSHHVWRLLEAPLGSSNHQVRSCHVREAMSISCYIRGHQHQLLHRLVQGSQQQLP